MNSSSVVGVFQCAAELREHCQEKTEQPGLLVV